MRTFCIAIATLGALAAGSASATPSAPARSCVEVGRGAIRVAATVARREDCCTGRMQCAQFLSTVTVMRPGGDRRT